SARNVTTPTQKSTTALTPAQARRPVRGEQARATAGDELGRAREPVVLGRIVAPRREAPPPLSRDARARARERSRGAAPERAQIQKKNSPSARRLNKN
ncbi:hypothetical protein ACWDR7_04070, partial [Microbacterium sp. NPDC003461]